MRDEALEKGLRHCTDDSIREIILSQKNQSPGVQLCLWPEAQRAAPNEIVRSALFNIRNRQVPREYLKDVSVAVLGDGEITYRGEELRQDDLDVWLQLMHLARGTTIAGQDIVNNSPTVKIVPFSFCKAIGWPTTGHYYNKLETTLGRLSATDLFIKSSRLKKGVAVSMIRKRVIRTDDEKSRLSEWLIWLEPEIVILFGGNYFSALDWKMRKQLSSLGKWLQAYYQSHRKPHSVKVATIMEACGSSGSRVRDFKITLEKALQELKDAHFLESYKIDDDSLVHVTRLK